MKKNAMKNLASMKNHCNTNSTDQTFMENSNLSNTKFINQTAVIWLKYCQYSVKHYTINQKVINQNIENYVWQGETGFKNSCKLFLVSKLGFCSQTLVFTFGR